MPIQHTSGYPIGDTSAIPEPSSGDKKGAPITMPTGFPSAYPNSDPSNDPSFDTRNDPPQHLIYDPRNDTSY